MAEDNPSASTTVELIRALNSSVVTIGVKKVIGYLTWITKLNSGERKDVADLVIHSVCQKYKVVPSNLMDKGRNDGDDFDAICIIAYLLNKQALMNQKQISIKVKRHKSQISKYITRIKTLNVELFKADAKLWRDCQEIEKAIEIIILKDQEQCQNQSQENAGAEDLQGV